MLSEIRAIRSLDQKSRAKLTEGCAELQEEYPIEEWLPVFLRVMPELRYAMSRKYVLFFARGHSTEFPETLVAARAALSDKSWIVREDALALLAQALDTNSLSEIEQLFSHADVRTRQAAGRAAKAIETGDASHFYVTSQDGETGWESIRRNMRAHSESSRSA